MQFAELNRAEHTVSEVAFHHGFPSSRAFSKAFQKKYGMLPSAYLQRKTESSHSSGTDIKKTKSAVVLINKRSIR